MQDAVIASSIDVQIYFLANCRSVQDVELVLSKASVLLPNVFAVEYDPHLVPKINLTETNARVHAAGAQRENNSVVFKFF